MKLRLLALDLDGTLLDPYAAVTPSARAAVALACSAGLEVVVCTGRRFRSTLPVLEQLGLSGTVVVNNGAIVKDIESGATLRRRCLPPEHYADAFAAMSECGSPLVFVDAWAEGYDFLIEADRAPHPFQTHYLDDHREHCLAHDDLARAPRPDVIMLSRMGDTTSLHALRDRLHRRFGGTLATQMLTNRNYRGAILELFSPASGKWNALTEIAAERGYTAEEIAAVGDDHNDAELVGRAGLGIAMGNAVDPVKAVAKRTVRSNAEGGIVEAIRAVLDAL